MNKPGLHKHPALLTYLSSLPTTTKRWKMAPKQAVTLASLRTLWRSAPVRRRGPSSDRDRADETGPTVCSARKGNILELFIHGFSQSSMFLLYRFPQTVQCAAVMPCSQLHYFSFCLSHNKALHHIYEQSVNLDFDSEIFARLWVLISQVSMATLTCVCVYEKFVFRFTSVHQPTGWGAKTLQRDLKHT